MGFFQQAVRSLKGLSLLPPGELPSQGLSPVFSFDFPSRRHRTISQVLWPEASFFPFAVSFSLPVPDPFPVLACFPPFRRSKPEIRISKSETNSKKSNKQNLRSLEPFVLEIQVCFEFRISCFVFIFEWTIVLYKVLLSILQLASR